MAERRNLELDPRFLVPPAVIDVRQDNETNAYAVYSNAQTVVEAVDGPILEFPNSSIPNAPSSYTIVSQTPRVGSDGSTVVDVLLEFPDSMGVYDIDVRLTPA